MIRHRPLLAAVALLIPLAAACSDDTPEAADEARATSTTTAATTSTTPDTSYAGICAALAAATDGNKAAVAGVFDHGPLHELAAAVTEVDRGAASQLLQAKEAVESGITDDASTAGDLGADLTALAAATRTAQQIVGDPVLPNCP